MYSNSLVQDWRLNYMYCKQCGTKLDDNAKFCGYCGTPVEQRGISQTAVIPENMVIPEPVVEIEPVVELEPVVEPDPIVEIEPVVEPEPIVELEPVVEPEPIVEIEPIMEPEPVVESKPVADTEFVVIPETYEPQPEVEWQEPADDMEWQAAGDEEVWSEEPDTNDWQDDNTEDQWSDTWSETEQTSGINWQSAADSQVPLVIEPKKKNTGLKVFAIIGCLLLTALIVVCAIWMNSADDDDYDDYDDFWAYEDEYEDELEDAVEDFQEEYGDGAFLDESVANEVEVTEEAEVTLSCGVTIPLDMDYVDLSGMIVSDLYGIEQCTQLQSLRVNGGSLTDLSPLVGLDQLCSLTLNNVPVSDIQMLQVLPNLTYLDITDTQVSPQQVKDLQVAMPYLTIVGHTYSTYEVIKQDCTWQEAVEMCEAKGGHLVTISDEAEMKKVIEALNGTELKYLWMGGYSEGDIWYWITGETWGGYVNWFPGEPSKQDTDGTLEYCLCLWNVDDNGWTMNDQRNDLPSFTSTQGRIGYICENEAIAGYK